MEDLNFVSKPMVQNAIIGLQNVINFWKTKDQSILVNINSYKECFFGQYYYQDNSKALEKTDLRTVIDEVFGKDSNTYSGLFVVELHCDNLLVNMFDLFKPTNYALQDEERISVPHWLKRAEKHLVKMQQFVN